MEKFQRFVLHNERYLALGLLLLGAALRLLGLGQYPPELNQDEAAIGYDAWALLNSGIDRNGDAWPVLFTSWGSGQNVLYAYLSLPALALCGLGTATLRATAGIFGSLSLLLVWLMARQSRGPVFGLWALGALALNPWHLLLSRWALESNLLPAFLLLGAYFLCGAARRPWLLLPAAAALGLSLYAYGTAYLFLPPFLIGASLLLWRRRFPCKVYLAALVIFVLVALPVSLCNLRNMLGLPAGKLWWMTLPKLTETRQTVTVRFSLENLAALGKLLWRQSDGLPWNSAGSFGLMYGLPGLLLAALGLGETVCRALRKRVADAETCLLLWLACALLAALFIQVNVNRVNMLFLPLIWCQGAGLAFMARRLAGLGPVLAGAGLAATVLLADYYVTDYRAVLAPAFHSGLTEAVSYAQATGAEEIWITDRVNMPYVYVLFATQPPPEDFLRTAEYVDPSGAFRQVTAFGQYRFGGPVPAAALRILPPDQADASDILAVFGGYAVAKPSSP